MKIEIAFHCSAVFVFHIKTSLLFITLLFSAGLSAEQLNFDKEDQGDSYQFNYTWLDIDQNQQQMSFSIAKSALFSPFRKFRAYKPDFASRHVQREIRKSLAKNPLKDVSISFNSRDGSAQLSSTEPSALSDATKRIRKEEQEFLNAYLKEQFYHIFTTHDGAQGVKPDHVSIAEKSVDALAPTRDIILEIVSVRNIRKVTNFVLSFVQSIPYSQLESRVDSSGAGFNVPTKVLWENQGDCDSKMTLTAAMLRSLMPRINMIMVYIDQHAFIGLEILPEGNDLTVNHQGRTFVLADPTGPRLMPLGEVSFDSEQAIKSGHYVAELFN